MQQQVQTAAPTSKTTIIKAEVPNTPLAIQQIQVSAVESLMFSNLTVRFSQNRLLLILLHSKFLLQTPDVSALLEAAVCQQEAQHQAAAQGTLVTTEAPAVANEEEISNIVHTS